PALRPGVRAATGRGRQNHARRSRRAPQARRQLAVMILWIEKRLALAIHDRQLAEHGGSSGVRDEGLLESALARPQQLFAYGDPPPDLADLAATLAYGLARNHPFVDGNKRTAYVACRTFLELNGASLSASREEKYRTI